MDKGKRDSVTADSAISSYPALIESLNARTKLQLYTARFPNVICILMILISAAISCDFYSYPHDDVAGSPGKSLFAYIFLFILTIIGQLFFSNITSQASFEVAKENFRRLGSSEYALRRLVKLYHAPAKYDKLRWWQSPPWSNEVTIDETESGKQKKQNLQDRIISSFYDDYLEACIAKRLPSIPRSVFGIRCLLALMIPILIGSIIYIEFMLDDSLAIMGYGEILNIWILIFLIFCLGQLYSTLAHANKAGIFLAAAARLTDLTESGSKQRKSVSEKATTGSSHGR